MCSHWDDFDTSLLSNTNYTLNKCTACGFIFQKSVLDDSFVYSEIVSAEKNAAKSERVGASEIRYFYFKAREVERISFFTKKAPAKLTVLDFGAGLGFWSRLAKAYGYTVYALDISKSRRDLFASEGITLVSHISELKGIEFDFIHCDQVLEHMQDPALELKKIVQALKKGGIIYLSVPNCAGIESRLKKSLQGTFLKEADPLSHINSFTYDTLTLLAKNAGLELLPAGTMVQGLTASLPKTQLLYMMQERLKYLYNQSTGTSLYFIKK